MIGLTIRLGSIEKSVQDAVVRPPSEQRLLFVVQETSVEYHVVNRQVAQLLRDLEN